MYMHISNMAFQESENMYTTGNDIEVQSGVKLRS